MNSIQSRFMELTRREWMNLLRGSALVVFLIWLAGVDLTFWPALGLWLTALIFGHLCMSADRYVAFPDLAAFACCLQWIVSPWLSTMYTPRMMVFRMMLSADAYLTYAIPATAALWIGLHLPSARHLAQSWNEIEIQPLSRRIQRGLDATIVVGLITDTYAQSFPPSLGFLVYLLASFRFFAALGWMVTATPGWKLRVGLVMVHLAAIQSSMGGSFYLFVHWGGYFLLVYAFMRRWRWRLAIVILIGALGIGLLQEVKPAFRTALLTLEVTGPVESLTKLVTMMYDRARGDDTVGSRTEFGDFLVRFNQGWIVSRVMATVPRYEPYAQGETVRDAAVFSIVPRALFPSKREGASRELFKRFTGVDLSLTTRMGLSVIGEFYANFSRVGGVIATFAYGWVIGLLFLWFGRRAEVNSLWWGAAAVVLLPTVEPGFNLEDVANHVVKAGAMLLVMRRFVPVLRHLLSVDAVEAEPAAATGGH